MSISTQKTATAPTSLASVPLKSSLASLPLEPRWKQKKLSPKRGFIYLIVFFLLVVETLFNAHELWGTIGHLIILSLEVAEALMDGALEHMGLSPGVSQLLTAYTGLLLFLLFLYWIYRKARSWQQSTIEFYEDYRDMYICIACTYWTEMRTSTLCWWKGLSWFKKVGAILFSVLVLIPLLIVLSIILGTLVSAVLF